MKLFLRFVPALAATLLALSCSRQAPLIGISCGHSERGSNTLADTYVRAVARAGGIPVIVPCLTDSSEVAAVLDRLDGIVFSGGEDFDPAYYGEEILPDAGVGINAHRDTSDLLYARGALRRRLPVLGICRGCQLMNVAAGGSLYQDLPTQHPSTVNHRDREHPDTVVHQLVVTPKSFLHKLMQADTLGVNSLHHQAVKELSAVYRLSAVSEDGVVEAFESKTVYAVQFHPEKLLAGGDERWLAVFEAFLKRCR